MAPPALLSAFGVFVETEFMDASERRRLEAAMKAGAQEVAEVIRGDGTVERDTTARSTRNVTVDPETVALVRERVVGLRGALERHFDVKLSGLQGPEFLSYREGDFFEAHRDGGEDAGGSEVTQARKLSVILFINGEREQGEPDGYEGGSLVLYGLMGDDEQSRGVGFPINPAGGELVAFPSSTLHEVQPLVDGIRYTSVCWFS